MRLAVSEKWLQETIARDPDVECEVGLLTKTRRNNMSWSFSAIGKPAAVAAAAVKQRDEGYKCVKPEEALRVAALDLIAAAAGAFPEGTVVRVNASGHQDRGEAEQAQNNLRIELEPVHGFME